MPTQPEQMGPMEALLYRMNELKQFSVALRNTVIDRQDDDEVVALTGERADDLIENIDDLLALVALLVDDHNDLLDLMDTFIKAKQKADAAPKLVVAGTGDLQALRQGRP